MSILACAMLASLCASLTLHQVSAPGQRFQVQAPAPVPFGGEPYGRWVRLGTCDGATYRIRAQSDNGFAITMELQYTTSAGSGVVAVAGSGASSIDYTFQTGKGVTSPCVARASRGPPPFLASSTTWDGVRAVPALKTGRATLPSSSANRSGGCGGWAVALATGCVPYETEVSSGSERVAVADRVEPTVEVPLHGAIRTVEARHHA